MSDGAQQGITPERALGTILGGEPAPSEDEGMSREAMETRIMAAPYPPETYDDAALGMARFILTTLRAHPDIATHPVEMELDMKNSTPDNIIVTCKGWSGLLKEVDPEGYARACSGISGFQWGYAVNAARYVLDLHEVANPALVTVHIGDAGDEG